MEKILIKVNGIIHSSTKKGYKKKDIVKRRKKNKNKKTHR